MRSGIDELAARLNRRVKERAAARGTGWRRAPCWT
jgi:hypothetical protein